MVLFCFVLFGVNCVVLHYGLLVCLVYYYYYYYYFFFFWRGGYSQGGILTRGNHTFKWVSNVLKSLPESRHIIEGGRGGVSDLTG